MLTYQDIVNHRRRLQWEFRLRNLFSLALIGYAAYCSFNLMAPTSPSLILIGTMALVSVALCLSITIVKIRQVYFSREAEASLMSGIAQAILQARLYGDYQVLNQLLDSEFSCHTILKMSEFPEAAYDYSNLAKWVKLKPAMQYFREKKITVKDFYDLDKMNQYLINVYPEFLEALSKHSANKI
jgi:hypothetical protein